MQRRHIIALIGLAATLAALAAGALLARNEVAPMTGSDAAPAPTTGLVELREVTDVYAADAVIDGVVTRRLMELGELATAGKAVLDMHDPSALRAVGSLPQFVLPRVARTDKATVVLPACSRCMRCASSGDPIARGSFSATWRSVPSARSAPGCRPDASAIAAALAVCGSVSSHWAVSTPAEHASTARSAGFSGSCAAARPSTQGYGLTVAV
jgi:hypothetical protein